MRVSDSEETVFVIVVNWNNASDTVRCLQSLSSVDYSGMRVMVVDNGSTDGSAGHIRHHFPQHEILELKSNRGFGGGCNAGHKVALEKGARYVVFLNNDTVVDPGFLEPLIAPLRERDELAVTVPRIYFMTRPDRIWYAGGEVNLLTGRIAHRGIRQPDGKRFGFPFETAYATGCCLAVRVSDFNDAGGFDPSFSMYAEDVDLSLRMQEGGKKILYVPASKVWHRVSASGGGELGLPRLWKKNRSILRLLVKHRAWSGIFFYLLLAPFRLVQGATAVHDFTRGE